MGWLAFLWDVGWRALQNQKTALQFKEVTGLPHYIGVSAASSTQVAASFWFYALVSLRLFLIEHFSLRNQPSAKLLWTYCDAFLVRVFASAQFGNGCLEPPRPYLSLWVVTVLCVPPRASPRDWTGTVYRCLLEATHTHTRAYSAGFIASRRGIPKAYSRQVFDSSCSWALNTCNRMETKPKRLPEGWA